MKLNVITPIGPGHEDTVHRAMLSVRIASKHGMGPFETVRHLLVDDTDGEMGRSAARNEATREAECDWIFFLDADDLMHPEALVSVENWIHDYDAIWGQIMEYREGCFLPRYQVPEIDCHEDLIAFDPYLTLQMGHFVRDEIAKANLFREDMDTGEDWDYYLRLWRNYRCYKGAGRFMVNVRGEHSVGLRSADGRQWMDVVHPMLANERERTEKLQNLSESMAVSN